MAIKEKWRINVILQITLIVAAFIAVSWLGKRWLNILSVNELLVGIWGMPLYILLTTMAVVIAPISTVPFIPLAVGLWGPVIAALLNIAGWAAGSAMAFLIARIFGQSLVARLIGVKNLNKLERFLPRRRLFWNVIFLRLILPVDILSYALGLFSNMKFSPYLLATLIGIMPFSFIFTYAVELPLVYQLAAGIAIIAFVVIINLWLIYRAKQRSNTMNQISS